VFHVERLDYLTVLTLLMPNYPRNTMKRLTILVVFTVLLGLLRYDMFLTGFTKLVQNPT